MPDENHSGSSSWTTQTRTAIVVSLLKGETSIEEAARASGASIAEIEEWKDEFLETAEEAVRGRTSQEVIGKTGSANDLGVWICATRRESLAPVLMMEAACAGQFPLSATMRWAGSSRAPRPFGKSGDLPLLHGVGSPERVGGARLLLFTTRLSETIPFESRSALSDWQLPVPVAGILVLLENEGGSLPIPGLRRPGRKTLSWVKSQQLPFVVAALGFEANESALELFRRDSALPSDFPMIVGPPLIRPRARRGERDGMARRFSIAGLLGVGDLRFDPDFARRIMAGLRQELS